ncbi:hypothetical protein AGR2A_Cc70041 [Agrobacterium genomosp. 2 str. CFBP 5494]|uniref:Type II toxin-antitoxin system RelE/ParE family toxin n=1 Tax=Agrobacterium genomosp. 2 str. CFBP 5494 TaxID=1183436 RepID=A0A9W5F184_9HYPH|nr:hypothetical protein AGR2A_Cc70041 [Agrobacterium genomosp. 2 str. CFBP 5494]
MTIKLFWSPRARSNVKKIYIDIGKSQRLAVPRQSGALGRPSSPRRAPPGNFPIRPHAG